MKKHLMLMVLGSLLILSSCGKDKVTVIHNNDRVQLLEARAALNEANDSLLEARVSSLESRTSAVEGQLSSLQSTVNNYITVTDADLQDLHNTDAQLANRINVHTIAIGILGAEILALKAKDVVLNSKIESLKLRVVAIEGELQAARATYPNLNARLNAMQSNLSSLNSNVNSLQSNVSALNTFAALQALTNGYVQFQMSQLNNRINNNSNNLAALTTQVQNLTSVVDTINSTYVTQSSAQADVTSLQNQINSLSIIADAAVTPSELAAAIAAIELLEGPQGPAGSNGTNGLPGQNGAQGQPGINGSTAGMSAVKLCAADNATYPEYGFVVGDSIYAVYYGQVNGTLSAFLARLNAGSYITTNDNSPCAFTVSYSNGNSYIDGVQVNPTTPVVTPALGQYRIDEYQNSNHSSLISTYYVKNVGLPSWSILNSSGIATNSHGFTVNNNANDLGKDQCNINNLSSVAATQVFEKCIVTKL